MSLPFTEKTEYTNSRCCDWAYNQLKAAMHVLTIERESVLSSGHKILAEDNIGL